MADISHTTNVPVLSVDDVTAGHYVLRANARAVLVDPANKGKPGDLVVLWPKRKAPAIVRRLARTTPYAGEAVGPAGPALLSDRFYFADPETGHTYDMAFKKVAAIHKVIGGLS